jgi:hypothetical protein
LADPLLGKIVPVSRTGVENGPTLFRAMALIGIPAVRIPKKILCALSADDLARTAAFRFLSLQVGVGTQPDPVLRFERCDRHRMREFVVPWDIDVVAEASRGESRDDRPT